ncbi:MAG TPA: hypothetical protein GXZ98_01525 [Firmicutes bacterium]|nr:hypothetical protein [Bacillota bacterium]
MGWNKELKPPQTGSLGLTRKEQEPPGSFEYLAVLLIIGMPNLLLN